MFILGMCTGLYPFIKLAKIVLNLFKFAIPIALIVLGTFDFVKAVIASKDDEMKKSQSIFIKRIIYAVAFFLLTTIVTFVMNFVADSKPIDASGNVLDVNAWYQCWSCKSKKQCQQYDAISDRSGGFYSKKDVSRNIDNDHKIVCSRDNSDDDYWCSIVSKNNDSSDNSSNGSSNSGINDCKDGQCLK